MREKDFVSAVTTVRIPNAEPLYARRVLSFNVTPTRRITALRKRVDFTSLTEYAWVGTIQKKDGTFGGDVFLFYMDGQMTGSVTPNGGSDVYRIDPLGNGLYALSAIILEKLPKHIDGTGTGRAPSGDPDDPKGTPDDKAAPGGAAKQLQSAAATTSGVYTQRVLAFYTPAAAAAVPNIGVRIASAVAEANNAYANSGINNVQLYRAATFEIDYDELAYNTYAADRDNMWNMSLTQTRREQYLADMVIFFTDGNYCTLQSCTQGIAKTILADENTAYALVEIESATSPGFTFTHEVGHLQGGRHHPDDDFPFCGSSGCPEDGFLYGRGHRFSAFHVLPIPHREYYATMMAYTTNDHHRIPYFSSPAIKYDGEFTGGTKRDNARALRTTAATIAGFRPEPVVPLSAGISGPTSGQNGEIVTLNAAPSGGTPPYTYSWTDCTTNFCQSPVVGTGSSYFSVLGFEDRYIKLRVTDATNAIADGYHIVTVTASGISAAPATVTSTDAGTTATEALPQTVTLDDAYPNPFNPQTVLRFALPEQTRVRLAVYDALGREVAVLVDGTLAAGRHEARFDAGGLPSGLYLYRLTAGTTERTGYMMLAK